MSQSEVPQAFHIMAKPTGAACNLHCDYCFFLKKEKLYPGSSLRMSDEVHEAYIRQLLEAGVRGNGHPGGKDNRSRSKTGQTGKK